MITATILTKNAAATLRDTLLSLQDFPEVLILDTGSTDTTLEIARGFSNVRLCQEPFAGFGPSHNRASHLATYDWILSIDSDEVLSDALCREILHMPLEASTVYFIERHNYFHGKQIRCCAGWYPDWVPRLYHRTATRFSNVAVHERIITTNCTIVKLRYPLVHTPYRSITDFLAKMQTYSTLFAEQHAGRKRASVWIALLHATCTLCKNLLLKRGMFGGRIGIVLSFYNAHTTFYKYLKLAEKNRALLIFLAIFFVSVLRCRL